MNINKAPVAWYSRKKSAVATSTADAEYRAIESALKSAILMKRTIQNLPIIRKPLKLEAHTDNKPALDIVHYLGGTKRSKLIYLRH